MGKMKERDLTKGSILKNILIVALPLILTNMVNMLYNFTDMYWISQIGPEGVSAVGTTGVIIWMGASIMILVNLGTQIRVSYAKGKGDKEQVKKTAASSLKFGLLVSISYGIILFLFANQIIGFFNIDNPITYKWAVDYLRICTFFIVCISINQTYTAIYNGLGNTISVLIIMCIGLIINIILDPLFINILDLKVVGAAIATFIASFISTIIFTTYTLKTTDLLDKIKEKFDIKEAKSIAKLGIFPTIQNMLFAAIAMIIMRFVSNFGDAAIAIQRVGNDIESLSWMIGIGITTAIGVFVGQNSAANKIDRVEKGSKIMVLTMLAYGVVVTGLFLSLPNEIFSIFFTDSMYISMGVDYLLIAAFAQIFMIMESTFTGIFNGYKKTNIAPFFSITGNLLRIPLAIILSSMIGLNGIWFALLISSIYKGLGVILAYFYMKRTKKIYI